MKVWINDDFWSPRMELNKKEALIYQWHQYKKCGTIDNFYFVAQGKHSHRKGYFYTDSDLHKWADAASRVLAFDYYKPLNDLLIEYIELMKKVQTDDGYIFTWNQIYYPQKRWINIHIEHELYTMGHFIEAGIYHYLVTKTSPLFAMAVKTADLIVKDFDKITASNCPGHQEIEIALLKLYKVTENLKYLNTAEQFLKKRGTGRFFGVKLLLNMLSHNSRNKHIKKIDGREKSKEKSFDIIENIQEKEPRFLALRSFLCFISGKYHQQHKPFIEQFMPQGHAVRWTYMMYAAAILNNVNLSTTLSKFLKKSWTNLIEKKMYITGGIGSLPVIEGFGRSYELNNEFSYSETCAAIGSIFCNNEMFKTSHLAIHADIIEKQLYNAALVGISQDGKKYFYRNPLESNGNLERRPWFNTACCPSNISRLWADVHKLIYQETNREIILNQYISNKARFEEKEAEFELTSGFPWIGQVQLKVSIESPLTIRLRIPGWAKSWKITVNGLLFKENNDIKRNNEIYTDIVKAGFYEEVELGSGKNQLIDIDFSMEIISNKSNYMVKENRGKIAISRGPLVYCVESDSDISETLDISSLRFEHDNKSYFLKTGYLTNNKTKLIPYYLWGNNGKKNMKVWLPEKNKYI